MFENVRATREEQLGEMPGDELVAEPMLCSTHAIDISVAPEKVWPWLAQMGSDRAGWYSWDRLDNAGRHSAERILPDLQRIAPGDLMPSLPGARDSFVVVRAEPPRTLVLGVPAPAGGWQGSWTFTCAEAAGRTRLVVRGRIARPAPAGATSADEARRTAGGAIYGAFQRLPRPVLPAVGALIHRIMEARQLRGIKRRAEALA